MSDPQLVSQGRNALPILRRKLHNPFKTRDFFTPKGLDTKAQGKRSAALGQEANEVRTPKGFYISRLGWQGRRLYNPFGVGILGPPATQGGASQRDAYPGLWYPTPSGFLPPTQFARSAKFHCVCPLVIVSRAHCQRRTQVILDDYFLPRP